MAEFPAMPLYTDAYLADTRHLTTEEHGAYLLLLMCAWRSRGCVLKDDDRQLARIVGVGAAKWRRLKPVLADFFTVKGGTWEQKKLIATHGAVAERVERNRINGAKGGRASAKRRSVGRVKAETSAPEAISEAIAGANTAVNFGENAAASATATAQATGKATKAKSKTKAKKESSSIKLIAAATGLPLAKCEEGFIEGWLAAGADISRDILPTLERLAKRERSRTGKLPVSLAYYERAVLEARDMRVRAVKRGKAHAEEHPAPAPKRAFDRRSAEDWLTFLGDSSSRFRGDYLSQNWRIPTDHPVFLAAGLGPDPRHSANTAIPDTVYEKYKAAWRWRPR